ncbi:MAG: hypothetical protein M3Y58_16090 [Chloroflexota bacterium]|nr:hypothetical protein [Chloroflexota bacterium]
MGLKRSLRFLGITLAMTALLSFIAVAPVAANTAGATLTPSKTTTTQRVRLSDGTNSGDTVEFVGNGFGPGEVVSIYLTFPDGRVFPVVNLNGIANPPQCCAQNDEVLADTTGSFFFRLRFGPAFNGNQTYPSTTGSATDGTQFTDNNFILPPEFAAAVPPYGQYTVTATGRVSLQQATASFTMTASTPDDFSRSTTGTLTVYTTIGHRTSAKQVDPGLSPTGVVDNPNVDIACNGLIPGEFVAFWDTYPDGSVVTLSTIAADDGGGAVLQLDLLTGKFPTGLHTFTCRGQQSNYYLTGSFLVLPGNISAQSSIGTLTASFVGAPQAVANATFPQLPSFFASDYLLLTARDFRPNETVTFWQTFPDQTAHFLATVKANEAGAAVVVIQLFPGPINYQVGKAILGDAALYQIAYPAGVDGRIPVGRQYFSARGDSTQRTASTPFDLLASQVDP